MPELVMPKMGDAMEEGTIVRWLKNEGDQVGEQEIVAEIATEKANIEIPSTEAGILSRILVKENETVPVGTPIAVIGNGKEAAAPAAAKPEAKPAEAKAAEQKPAEVKTAPEPAPAPVEHGNGHAPGAVAGDLRVKATPLAKKVAAQHGLDLTAVAGSGPGGRIIEADVQEALQRGGAPAQPAAPAGVAAVSVPQVNLPGTERPMSPMRKVIAKRLLESKQNIPHFYVTLDVDMRAASRIRTEYNASVEEERKISFNDLIMRATVLALQKHRALTAQIVGDSIRIPSSINLGVAVSLEDGLIVPVIKDAQNKSMVALGQEIKELASRARKGQLKPEEYSGGSFTISNLGMFEVSEFQAIINPPEVAILAVGSIQDVPVVDNGQIVPGKIMKLTISADHRAVDGAVAAQFMQELKRLLQSPLGLFS